MTTNALVLSEAAPPASAQPVSRHGTALTPQGYGEMFRLAEMIHKSAMFGVRNAEQAMVVLMTGIELGFSPTQSFRGIHVINNKPTLSADMMVAVCKARPDICHYFRLVESTDDSATYETHRVGEPEPTRNSFSLADAKRAGLLTNPTWQKFPAQMIRARASSGLARIVYSDLILGLYTQDEIENVPVADRPQPTDRSADRTHTAERPQPVNVTPRSEDRARPATRAAEAVSAPKTIQEQRTHLRQLIQSMSDADAEASLAVFQDVFGRNDYSAFDLDQCRRAITAIQTGVWPDAAEADPFDDANGFKAQQPALMEADVPAAGNASAGQGHGDS